MSITYLLPTPESHRRRRCRKAGFRKRCLTMIKKQKTRSRKSEVYGLRLRQGIEINREDLNTICLRNCSSEEGSYFQGREDAIPTGLLSKILDDSFLVQTQSYFSPIEKTHRIMVVEVEE